MPTTQLIRAFLDQATAQGSRSTVLRPLAWIIAICVGAVLGAVEFKAPPWIVDLFGLSVGVAVTLYFVTYLYCLFTKKEDLLRSETYSIQKLAIEKGFVGDSLAGIFQVETAKGERLLGTSTDEAARGEK